MRVGLSVCIVGDEIWCSSSSSSSSSGMALRQ